MRFFTRHRAIVCLVVLLLLSSGVHHASASSSDGATAAASRPEAMALVENIPGLAKVIRTDKQSLFVLQEDFLWAITDLADDGMELRPTGKVRSVVALMQPGDYLIIPQQKAREVQNIEIADQCIYLETAILERRGGAGDDKGQVVGSESWPFDIPILDLQDQVLFDGELDEVPVKITANSLFIEMSGELLFGYNFDIVPPDIYYLLLEFDSDLVVTVDYSLEVGGALNHNFDLLTFSIPVFTVGWATINVDVALPTELTTGGPVCLGGGLSFDYGYAIGFEVLGDEVTAIWETAPGSFSDLDPAYGTEADASMKTTLDLGVSAVLGIPDLFEVASAAFDLAIYTDTVGVQSPCTWALDAGIAANLAITEFTGLICGPGECDWQLFDASIYSDVRTCDQLTDNCACTAMVCPSGCCAGNSCEPGTADNACGVTGDACVTCASDQHCVEGICIDACDAQLCPAGCCDGTTCQPGDTDDLCGTGGAECFACEDNQQCKNHECRTLCDPSLCPLGCCDGKQCQPGDDNDLCGSGGEVCQACESGKHCEAGDCVPDTVDDDTTPADDDTTPVDDDTTPVVDDDTTPVDDDTADDDVSDDDAAGDDDDNDISNDDESPPAREGDDDDDSGGCGC